MAKAEMVVEVRLRDLDRFRLFVWELHQLLGEMRVMASPHAEPLESLLERVSLSDSDDRIV